jgi:hypothetical protein
MASVPTRTPTTLRKMPAPLDWAERAGQYDALFESVVEDAAAPV